MIMNLVLKALQFADRKHEGQVRRGSGDKYITHPVAVSYLVASYKKSKHLNELLAASLLHDTLEDTDTTFVELAVEFTPLVAGLVQELTNDESQIKSLGKLEYHKRKLCGISSYGLIIKLADRIHNVSDMPTAKMVCDTIQLMLHLIDNRKVSKTHREMINEIIRLCQATLK